MTISSKDDSVNVNKNTISPDTLNIYKNTRLNIFLKLQTGISKSRKKIEIKREITKPVFLPGESHGQRRLGDYCPWGHNESDMSE